MKTKRLVSARDAESLEKIIIDYVTEKRMTISNVRDCIENVERYMRNNAILGEEDLE